MRSRLSASKEVCRLLYDKLAKDVVLFKNPRLNTIADYFIIGSVTSGAHMEALERHLRRSFKDRGIVFSRATEGRGSSSWRILDAGFVVIHLMDEQARQRYRLQDLWSEATKIAWKTLSTRSKKLKKS